MPRQLIIIIIIIIMQHCVGHKDDESLANFPPPPQTLISSAQTVCRLQPEIKVQQMSRNASDSCVLNADSDAFIGVNTAGVATPNI